MYRALLFTVLAVNFLNAFSQVIPCHTDEKYRELLKNNPELKLKEEAANINAANYVPALGKSAVIRYIPIVFHVIHNYGEENISQAQINDQIRILNEDFRKITGTNGGSSTDPLASDIEIEFRLAQFGPDGKPTDGVNRIQSSLTYNADDNTKTVSYWPSNKYLNIWVVNSINSSQVQGTILGYAQFPWNLSSSPTTDGIIIRYDMVGAIEKGSTKNIGRTLTHEIGHWLGLYHTFQDGCPNSNCSSQGDRICDTPPVAAANYGCPAANTNSCTSDNLPDQVANYMDYADGTCVNMFTSGQKNRINGMIQSYRASVYNTANLSNVGVNTDGTYTPLAASSSKGFSFDFNVSKLAGTGWTTEAFSVNPDTGWLLNTNLGHNENGCMYTRNFLNQKVYSRSSFSSPQFDVTGLAKPALSFYVAYSKKSSLTNDRLVVYVSNNYGRTESILKTYLSGELQTVSEHGEEYVPAGKSDWKKLLLDLSAYKNYSNMSIRFELQNLRGNNMYIDDIMIDEVTAGVEDVKNAFDFNFFPNPFSEKANINFVLNKEEKVLITLYDLSGKIVRTISNETMTAGAHHLDLEKNGLNSGIYFLEFSANGSFFNHKVVIY